jgi:hypothetical protein
VRYLVQLISQTSASDSSCQIVHKSLADCLDPLPDAGAITAGILLELNITIRSQLPVVEQSAQVDAVNMFTNLCLLATPRLCTVDQNGCNVFDFRRKWNHVLQIWVTEGRSALSVAAAGSVHRLAASACAGCFASSHASVLSNHALCSSLIASAFDRYAKAVVQPKQLGQ